MIRQSTVNVNIVNESTGCNTGYLIDPDALERTFECISNKEKSQIFLWLCPLSNQPSGLVSLTRVNGTISNDLTLCDAQAVHTAKSSNLGACTCIYSSMECSRKHKRRWCDLSSMKLTRRVGLDRCRCIQ